MTTKIFSGLLDVIRAHAGRRVRLIDKDTSVLHRVISWVLSLFGMRKRYMTGFWTTIGWTIARVPGSQNVSTLSHEGTHVLQQVRMTRLLFGALYLLPQLVTLPLMVVLAAFGGWNGLAAGAVMFVGTFPLAYWRMRLELEAYMVSAIVETWQRGSLSPIREDQIVSQFTGPSYGFMWPWSSGHIRERLRIASWVAKNYGSLSGTETLARIVGPDVALYLADVHRVLFGERVESEVPAKIS